MRGKKINFSEFVRRMLVISCAVFAGSTSLFSESTTEEPVPEKMNSSKVYYVTWQIDRNVAPFLRQIKTRITRVPAPHQNVKLYSGRQWHEFVDAFLTKNDSSQKQPFPVMIPLPAACFDRNLNSDMKKACLENPSKFADGFVELGLQEVRSFKTLSEIIDSNGVPAFDEQHRSYNKERWISIVTNLNPKINMSGMIQPGTVLIFPTIMSSDATSEASVVPIPRDSELPNKKESDSNIVNIRPDDAANVVAETAKDSLRDVDSASSQLSVQENAGAPITKTKIFFTTLSVDRKAGPYLRQIKAKLGTVPPPYDNPEHYDGRSWEDLVDTLLIKQDSALRKPVDVLVPLPAGCFSLRFSTSKKDACLKNPPAFAAGVLTLDRHTVGASTTIDDVLAANGVPAVANPKKLSFYSLSRWIGVVKNFNPKRIDWKALTSGDVIILPKINPLGESAVVAADSDALNSASASLQQVVKTGPEKDGDFVKVGSDLSKPTDGNRSKEAAAAMQDVKAANVSEPGKIAKAADPDTGAGTTDAARAIKAAGSAGAIDAARAEKGEKAAAIIQVAEAAEALAKKVAMEAELSAKAAKAAKSAEDAVAALAAEAAERSKRLAEAKRIIFGNTGDWERLPGKSLSLQVSKNALSSAAAPMLKKQTTSHLMFAYAEDETMDFFGSVMHSSFVKANSESDLLTRADDPLEYFRFSNVDFGARFYFQSLSSNMELSAGLYARLAIMDIRYYISNYSDDVAYLLEDHTNRNVGLGITGALTFTKRNMRYGLSALKDLYEFVDQALLIGRANNRLTLSYYTPRPEGRDQLQRNYDLFLESETIDVHLIDKEANLHAEMRRFSVGLGLGVAW